MAEVDQWFGLPAPCQRPLEDLLSRVEQKVTLYFAVVLLASVNFVWCVSKSLNRHRRVPGLASELASSIEVSTCANNFILVSQT